MDLWFAFLPTDFLNLSDYVCRASSRLTLTEDVVADVPTVNNGNAVGCFLNKRTLINNVLGFFLGTLLRVGQ